ncbi:RING finger protein 24 [Manacus vitellinus]|uniref:RING finger protein 24 n=1 Tax=Manacus vitellinus TaxID=328815 RepID=UPI00115E58AB|nr:RING finger protein 24 [Manacus vitellinus]
MNLVWDSLDLHRGGLKGCPGRLSPHGMAGSLPMSSDFQHYSFRMPNIGFQNLPLNIYIVVFGTAIFVFILSLLFCCYLIRLRHQAHKELYAYKQVILKEKVKELNLHEALGELGMCVFLGGWSWQLCLALVVDRHRSRAEGAGKTSREYPKSPGISKMSHD